MRRLRGWLVSTLDKSKKRAKIKENPFKLKPKNKGKKSNAEASLDDPHITDGSEEVSYHGLTGMVLRGGNNCFFKVALDTSHSDTSSQDAGYGSKEETTTDSEEVNEMQKEKNTRRSMIKTNPWVGPQKRSLQTSIETRQNADEATLRGEARIEWPAPPDVADLYDDEMSDISSESGGEDEEEAYLGDSSSVTSVDSDSERGPYGFNKRTKVNTTYKMFDSPDEDSPAKHNEPLLQETELNDSGFESNTGTQLSNSEPSTPQDDSTVKALKPPMPSNNVTSSRNLLNAVSTSTHVTESTEAVIDSYLADNEEFNSKDSIFIDEIIHESNTGGNAYHDSYAQSSTLLMEDQKHTSRPSPTILNNFASNFSSSASVYHSNGSLSSNMSMHRDMRMKIDKEERVRSLTDVQHLIEMQLRHGIAGSQPSLPVEQARYRKRSREMQRLCRVSSQPLDKHHLWKEEIIQFRCQLMLYRKQRLLMTLQCLREQIERETARLEQSTFSSSVSLSHSDWWRSLQEARESLV